MKKIIAAICLCIAAGGCSSREASVPLEREEDPVILVMAESDSEILPQDRLSGHTEEFCVEDAEVNTPIRKTLKEAVSAYCKEYGVEEAVVYAVMETESGFQEEARNGACAGLMQIHSINLPWLEEQIGVKDLGDPVQNIQAGVYMLGQYLEKYSLTDSLMCYNLGEGGAKQMWAQGIHETEYTRRVLERMEAQLS